MILDITATGVVTEDAAASSTYVAPEVEGEDDGATLGRYVDGEIVGGFEWTEGELEGIEAQKRKWNTSAVQYIWCM